MLDLKLEKRFMQEGGDDWRKSRYLNVISYLKTHRHDVEQNILSGLDRIDELGRVCAVLNSCEDNYNPLGTIDLDKQNNYYELDPSLNYHDNNIDSRYVKQRTDRWFEIRKEAFLTASTLHRAIGMEKLNEQQQLFDKKFHGNIVAETYSSEQTKNMEFGTQHEIDAIATIVSKVLPVFYPTLSFVEEGCIKVPYKGKSFLVVSPDGSLRAHPTDANPTMMVEIKCRLPKEMVSDVYYEIPIYHLIQTLSQMHAYKCQKLLFACWSLSSTVVFELTYNENVWTEIWRNATKIYDPENPKRPTKLTEDSRDLKRDVMYRQNSTKIIGEFRSVEALLCQNVAMKEKVGPYLAPQGKGSFTQTSMTLDLVQSRLHSILKWLNEVYQLNRSTASEMLAFMINDFDRAYKLEMENANLIGYALKGPSLTNDTFRSMVEFALSKCDEKGLNVSVISTDGQWHKYGVRDETGEPLTVYQLQRDIWIKYRKMQKDQLISELKDICNFKADIMLSITTKRLPTVSPETLLAIKKALDLDSSQNKSNTVEFTRETKQAAQNIQIEIPSIPNQNKPHKNDAHDHFFDISDAVNPNTSNIIPVSISLEEVNIGHEIEQISSEIDLIEKVTDDIDNNVNVDEGFDFECLNQLGSRTHSSPQQKQSYILNMSMLDLLFNEDEGVLSQYEDGANHQNVPLGLIELPKIRDYIDESEIVLDQANELQNTQNEHINDQMGYFQSMTTESQIDLSEDANSSTKEILGLNPAGPIGLNDLDFSMMLLELKQLNKLTKKNFNVTTITDMKDTFKTVDTISSALNKTQLSACAKAILGKLKRVDSKISKNWPKYKLLHVFGKLIGDNLSGKGNHFKSASKRKTWNPISLRSLCSKLLKKLPKEIITAAVCELKWQDHLHAWQEKAVIPNNIPIERMNVSIDEWFSQPARRKTDKVLFHLTDACHLLTSIRTKICTTGMPNIGINRKAWEVAALSDRSSLNIAVVTHCIDKQSVAFAKQVFADDVENIMRSEGFLKEANFCKLMREWFEAEDEPGISAVERCRRRLQFRDWLLRGQNFGQFPPKTKYIQGMSAVTFEGLVTHLERKIQLYPFTPSGTYNVRAVSSQVVEQFFGRFRDLDPSGLGTPKPDAIPGMISTAIELDNIRMNPDRHFYMRTSRAPVYIDHPLEKTDLEPDVIWVPPKPGSLDGIEIRDHFFDTEERAKQNRRKKIVKIAKPGLPAHNELGVRMNYHRRDDSKIPAHLRANLLDVPN